MVQQLNQILHKIDKLQRYLLIIDSLGAIGAAIESQERNHASSCLWLISDIKAIACLLAYALTDDY